MKPMHTYAYTHNALTKPMKRALYHVKRALYHMKTYTHNALTKPMHTRPSTAPAAVNPPIKPEHVPICDR